MPPVSQTIPHDPNQLQSMISPMIASLPEGIQQQQQMMIPPSTQNNPNTFPSINNNNIPFPSNNNIETKGRKLRKKKEEKKENIIVDDLKIFEMSKVKDDKKKR